MQYIKRLHTKRARVKIRPTADWSIKQRAQLTRTRIHQSDDLTKQNCD